MTEMNMGVAAPPAVSDDDRMWAMLIWMFPGLAIIILLFTEMKDRPFIRYHAVSSLALSFVSLYIGSLLYIVFGLGALIQLAAFVYQIIMFFKAYNGKFGDIMLVTDFLKKEGWIANV